MAGGKKRTPRSVERHAANRAANLAQNSANIQLIVDNGLAGHKRPSKVVRQDQRALLRLRSPEPEDAA